MEPLYKIFQSVPIDSMGFQGLVVLVVVAFIIIFKIVIKKPKK